LEQKTPSPLFPEEAGRLAELFSRSEKTEIGEMTVITNITMCVKGGSSEAFEIQTKWTRSIFQSLFDMGKGHGGMDV